MIKLIKNKVIVCFLILILSCFGLILFTRCVQGKPVKSAEGSKSSIVSSNYGYPKVASWLSKKEELISSNKPFDLIMTGWVTSEDGLEAANSDYIIIYGVDTDDSRIKDLKRMRLCLTLSL